MSASKKNKPCEPAPRYYFHSNLTAAEFYENRPELDRVLSWWKKGGAGVCALVGMGGAGKSATAQKFLSMIPDVMEDSFARNWSLAKPNAAFVFSFSDNPDPAYFFTALTAWLDPNQDPVATRIGDASTSSLSFRAIQLVSKCSGLLIVMDEFEQIQHFESQGAGGRITDRGICSFLSQVVRGQLRGVSVLITTRYNLQDFEEDVFPLYECIEVLELPKDSAVELLRKRGVKGPQQQLEDIVVKTGLHALTVDILGGFLATFHAGLVPPGFTLPRLRSAEAFATEQDPKKRKLQKQQKRLEVLTEGYCEALKVNNPAALALLERLTLFRSAVPTDLLLEAFPRDAKQANQGDALPESGIQRVQAQIESLIKMRLVETPKHGVAFGYSAKADQVPVFSVHPALKETLSRRLSPDEAIGCHKAVLEALITRLTAGNTGSYPTDSLTLDLLTETIYHCVRAEEYRRAWALYVQIVGGFANLGRRLGAYWRGERLCSTFAGGRLDSTVMASLPEDARLLCLYDWGRFLLALGRLDQATVVFELHNRERMEQGNWLYVGLGFAYLCELNILAGDLTKARECITEARKMVSRTGAAGLFRDLLAYKGYIEFLTGNSSAALKDLELGIPRQLSGIDYRLPVEWKALCLARSGKYKQAIDVLQEKSKLLKSVEGEDFYRYLAELAVAEVSLESQIPGDWENRIRSAENWAVENDAREVLCRAAIVGSRSVTSHIVTEKREPAIEDVRRMIENGILIARECGYSLLHIELLLSRAYINLVCGRPKWAVADAEIALFGVTLPSSNVDSSPRASDSVPLAERGIFRAESGWPPLLAATNDRCGYKWGEVRARWALAEGLCLNIAQAVGSSTLTEGLEPGLASLLTQARFHLTSALSASDSAGLVRSEGLRERLNSLEAGKLTAFPLEEVAMAIETPGATGRRAKSLFVSYSHKDAKWLEAIKTTLAPLIRNRSIVPWDDTKIKAGDLWKIEIEQALASASLALLLVTPNFIASPYITDQELPPILEAAKERGLRILWIPIIASVYEHTPLVDYQALQDPEHPLETLKGPARRQLLVKIARKIAAAVDSMN